MGVAGLCGGERPESRPRFLSQSRSETGILSGRGPFMRSSRPPRGGSPGHAIGGRPLAPAALPALLRATHLSGLAPGSALGGLRESGVTAAKLFERAEESALLLRMTLEAAGILRARWNNMRTSARIRLSVVPLLRRSISAGRRPTFPRSRLPAAGRAKP